MGKTLTREERKNNKYTVRDNQRENKQWEQENFTLEPQKKKEKPKPKWKPRDENDDD